MESTEHTLTPADALAFIRKQRGKTLFISVGQFAPVMDKPHHGFPVMGNVEVTRKVALKFVADAYSEVMAARGAMCCISTLHECVFIGRSA